MRFDTGLTYIGDFKDGTLIETGDIQIKFKKDGDEYEGKWVEKKLCGHGKMIYSDGNQYVGAWDNDL